MEHYPGFTTVKMPIEPFRRIAIYQRITSEEGRDNALSLYFLLFAYRYITGSHEPPKDIIPCFFILLATSDCLLANI